MYRGGYWPKQPISESELEVEGLVAVLVVMGGMWLEVPIVVGRQCHGLERGPALGREA